MTKKYLIIGAGAIGVFYASKLSQVGDEIIIWSRNDYEFIAKQGYQISSESTNYKFFPNLVIRDLDQLNQQVDYIIVATKVLPSINIIEIVQKVLAKNTTIIIIQNGIHLENKFIENFPNNQIISAIAFIGVYRQNINYIIHQAFGKLIIGNCNKIDIESINYFANSIKKSGIEVNISDNILLERWKKLIWNGAFNPLSVILGGKTTRQILDNKLAFDLVKNIMSEIKLLAKHDNCELPDDIIDINISATQTMTPYKTSMLLDFEASRPMEIEAIIGNAIKFAESKSLSIPYLSTVYAIISNY